MLRRSPQPQPPALPETGWYDELGLLPTATQEEIQLRYLERAEEVEDKLAYLLEEAMDRDEDGEDDEDVGDDDDPSSTKMFQDPDLGDESIQLQDSATLANAMEEEEEEERSEADKVALEFMRLSNLYQILSVPQLRRIYDQGGVEALAMRVPRLHKGLLEPERVLKMAR